MISNENIDQNLYLEGLNWFDFDVNPISMSEDLELSMIDTNVGSDTVIMVWKVLEWAGSDFDKDEWW